MIPSRRVWAWTLVRPVYESSTGFTGTLVRKPGILVSLRSNKLNHLAFLSRGLW